MACSAALCPCSASLAPSRPAARQSMICMQAAYKTQLPALKWENMGGLGRLETTNGVYHFAATKRNLEMLRWARLIGCPWDDNVLRDTVVHGRFEVAVRQRLSLKRWVLQAGTQNLWHSTPHGPFYKTLSL